MSEGAVVPFEEQKLEKSERTMTDVVNEAVGSDYSPAYVAAMVQLLPPEFRSPVDVISLGIRARKSGLDPFSEIHAWKNEKGRLHFQIARDGFIFMADQDPHVESLEFQHVYEGEEFSWSKDGDGSIQVSHSGSMVKGKLLGAYCVAHMKDRADHMEMRLVEHYSHLMNKPNWKYLPEMLITRVIGSTVRLVCPDRAGGLYSEADMELAEIGEVAAVVTDKAAAATEASVKRLAGRAPREVEVEALDPTEASPPKDPESDTTPSSTEGGELEDRWECDVCHKAFSSQQGLAGHMRAHKKDVEPTQPIGEAEPDTVPTPPSDADQGPSESDATDSPPTTTSSAPDTSGAKESIHVELPEGYIVYPAGGGNYELVGPDGEIIGGTFLSVNDAALAAQNALYAAQKAAERAQAPLSLGDVYAWCAKHGVKATAVNEIINDSIYGDEFERFRGEGAEKINIFNLDEDARRTLLEILQEKHG